MLPSTRVRQQRPHQIPLEEPRTAGPFHSGTSAFSWVILMGGMLLAVAGVVHAAWPSSEDQGTAAPSIAQDVLNQQIAQLKAELDKERAEKTELMDNMAAAKSPAAEPPPVRVAVQKVTQAVAEDSDPTQAQAQVAELQVPEVSRGSICRGGRILPATADGTERRAHAVGRARQRRPGRQLGRIRRPPAVSAFILPPSSIAQWRSADGSFSSGITHLPWDSSNRASRKRRTTRARACFC